MAGRTAADAKTPLKLKKVVLTEDQLNLVCSDHILSCLLSFLFFFFATHRFLSRSLSGQLVSLSFGSIDFYLFGLWKELKNLWGGGGSEKTHPACLRT